MPLVPLSSIGSVSNCEGCRGTRAFVTSSMSLIRLKSSEASANFWAAISPTSTDCFRNSIMQFMASFRIRSISSGAHRAPSQTSHRFIAPHHRMSWP